MWCFRFLVFKVDFFYMESNPVGLVWEQASRDFSSRTATETEGFCCNGWRCVVSAGGAWKCHCIQQHLSSCGLYPSALGSEFPSCSGSLLPFPTFSPHKQTPCFSKDPFLLYENPLAWLEAACSWIKQPQSFSSCTLELFKEKLLSLSLAWLCYCFNDHSVSLEKLKKI